MRQRVYATGHENVTAEHESTFELTSDDWLTPAGDCILGVEAGPVPAAFDEAFVSACQSHDAVISVELSVNGYTQRIEGSGHPELTFESDRSMVVRTSDYVDDRTIAVDADAAAVDIIREIVSALAEGAEIECLITIER